MVNKLFVSQREFTLHLAYFTCFADMKAYCLMIYSGNLLQNNDPVILDTLS
jgi:hypothetical protein